EFLIISPCTNSVQRNCIGQNFAMNEMKVVVAMIIKKYVLIKDPEHTPKIITQWNIHQDQICEQ
uniref:Uncharacterized protein n=1 Tax=Electrophorus electricus TaxID=8005 RepID=A0AAY5EDL3_ELEEL